MKKQINIDESAFIASGATGNIYKIDNFRVIKLAKNAEMASVLQNEATIYQIFNNTCKYIPKYYESGIYKTNISDKAQYGIIIEYIHFDTLEKNIKYITQKNIKHIFMTMMKIIECFHNKNFVIKDIKPENFLYDPATNKLWMCDLGLVSYAPFKYTETDKYTGTLRYISPRCHNHVNTYYDDIESAVYTIIYCYYGYLPWKIVKLDIWDDQQYSEKIRKIKEERKADNLIKAFPYIDQVYQFSKQSQNLCNKPDYSFIWTILNKALQ